MKFNDDKLIYVVDDSEIIADMLRKAIDKTHGYAAVDFHSGEEMLHYLSVRKPHLILLDYYLNEDKRERMNGQQVLQTIKVLYPDLPVVLITGMSDEQKLTSLKNDGYDDVIHKDHPKLLQEVIDCLDRFAI